MRVLVTGGTGLVGKPAVDRLVGRGHTVRLLSRQAGEDVRQWAEGVEPWPASLGEPAALQGAADGCDAVLHVAGIEKEDPPELTFQRINVEGTRLLITEAERAGVARFVYVSSLGAERGRSDYHRSKHAAEEVVRGFRGAWSILRPGNVYGPGDQVISLLLRMMRVLPVIPIVGDGDHPFQPVWAEDLGAALALAVEREGSGEVLPLAGREVTTMNQVLDLLEEITDNHRPRIPIPSILAEVGAFATSRLGIDLPVNEDQIVMLQEENVIDPPEANALIHTFAIDPIPLREGLVRLADAQLEVLPGEGVGSLHRQRYWADIEGSRLTPEEQILLVRTEFQSLTPGVIQVGTEPGAATRLDEGNTITMDLPLRGTVQVRVEKVEPLAVTQATLQGHHLAGFIRFQAKEIGPGRTRFEIISFTQAASWLDELGRKLLGRVVQKGAWARTVEALVERTGGSAPDGVQTEDEVLSESDEERIEDWARELVMARKRNGSDEGAARHP
jgi:NADH dehydrogenase